jgi:putative DNA primase/helicase
MAIEKKKEQIKNIDKLPDVWTLSEEFIKNNPYLKYCSFYHSFYNYNAQDLIWKTLEKIDVQNLLIKWLKTSYNKNYKSFSPRKLEEIIMILQSETRFSLIKAKAEVNKDGFLIPFKNGLLNSKTMEFLEHSPSLYCTHLINVNYDPESKELENSFLAEILSQFVNFNSQRLNLLRAMLYTIFNNDTIYQLAWYIYGPGGNGKSTLINLILYLLGPEASYSTSLTNINSRFGKSNISNKIFLVINDMTQFKGKEPKIFKEIITGDSIENEKKYKDSVSINPQLILAITNNSIWELINPTGGFNRRIVYFPADFIVINKNLDLFCINNLGDAQGKILPCLPAFINWILSCPKEYIDSLKVGGEELSKFINPNIFITSQHLSSWIENNLTYEEKTKTPIGTKNSDKNTLYGNYLNWCVMNNIEQPIKINRFSELLLDNLKSLKWKFVEKKRTSAGYFIINIKINNKEQLNIINYNNNNIKLGTGSDKLNFSKFSN